MIDNEARIVHAIPGRIRIKLGNLKGNAPLANHIQERLAAVAAIKRVETSLITGSVLVTYDPALLESDSPLDALHAIGPFAGVEAEHINAWLQPPASGSAEGSSTLAGTIDSFMSGLNDRVAQATGGQSDLRVLVPLTLAFLGLRGLLFSGRVAGPAWYDLLWFAFSSFVVLHPQRQEAK